MIGGKAICPQCSHTRKHKSDKCLSVDLKEGLFNCHNCGFSGSAKEFKPQKIYTRPIARPEKVNKKTVEYFEKERKISDATLSMLLVTEAKEWMPQFEKEVTCICFNYYREEELINIKFRGPKKSFKMAKDAELIFYNINSIKDKTSCIIVEGEMDCLTLVECGIYNGISVPNGASKGNQKLEYLDNCWQYFENKTKIILAV
ncbi:MAG TPA: toprim domain-containing protein, partial [Chitinophagaceae bacterium]